MLLRCLKVTDFRNLKTIDIELGDRLNVFFGDNGSGKTSLLESIHTLSSSRSFRSRKYKSLINHSADQYTLFCSIESKDARTTIGIQRANTGSSLIRVNQKNIYTSSALAELLPVRVIDAYSFSVLDGSPHERRKLLDWLVFHVEHRFLNAWKGYEKCIKQRNTLLRHDKIDQQQLQPWDDKLSSLAIEVDTYRQVGFELLNNEFKRLIADVAELPEGIELTYRRGWDKDTDYADYLKLHQERDIHLGYTRQGPHRADIKVSAGLSLAADVLSRGQQKMVICALMLAQGRVFTNTQQRQCVYLVDDLVAELDAQFRVKLCGWLYDLGSQVVITGVEADPVLIAWPNQDVFNTQVFHVEHGCVTENKTNK
jgi:DNA replication and repair protein RecF